MIEHAEPRIESEIVERVPTFALNSDRLKNCVFNVCYTIISMRRREINYEVTFNTSGLFYAGNRKIFCQNSVIFMEGERLFMCLKRANWVFLCNETWNSAKKLLTVEFGKKDGVENSEVPTINKAWTPLNLSRKKSGQFRGEIYVKNPSFFVLGFMV